MRIIAVDVHPDYVKFCCCIILSYYKSVGHKIFIALLCSGELLVLIDIRERQRKSIKNYL